MNKFEQLVSSMGNHSLVEYPKEACGIITKDLQYIPTKNISKNPKNSFIIDPIAIVEHYDNIWGFFHSHPGSVDPIPSSRDLASTSFTEYSFIVGFGNNFYKYWSVNEELRFERLNEHHINYNAANN
jgi:proteasome lid subunit RPN8/RPN11